MKQRIQQIQSYLKNHQLDALLVPSTDDHGSEYIGEHFKVRAYLSGFHGSAGTLIITKDQSYCFTDSRYFIQAKKELQVSGTILMKMGEVGVPSIEEFLEKKKVLVDYKTLTWSFATTLHQKGVILVDAKEYIDSLWENRPPVDATPVFQIPKEAAGFSVKEKLQQFRLEMQKNKCNYSLISSLDDLAWLLNIRGNDISYNPVTYAYLLVSMSDAKLYIDEKKVSKEIQVSLENDSILLRPYDSIYSDMLLIQEEVLIDVSKCNYALQKSISKPVCVPLFPTTFLKAQKNDKEIENIKEAHIKDAVAMIEFMKYLKESYGKTTLSELSLAKTLEGYRKKQVGYIEPSFGTICAWRDHAAIVHYEASEESNVEITGSGLLLVDSGAQYNYGTTDITRTFALGNISNEEKHDFTLVLKAHIALAKASFKRGYMGVHLDMLPKNVLFSEGKEYKHGTGHGVGYLLNVHEGPQNISPKGNKCSFLPGMITSNEPGYYLENQYGIRHENLVLCKELEGDNTKTYLHFETITLVPFDIDGIDVNMLNSDEKEWLNQYNQKILQVVGPRLDQKTKEYLINITKPIQ